MENEKKDIINISMDEYKSLIEKSVKLQQIETERQTAIAVEINSNPITKEEEVKKKEGFIKYYE